MWTCWSQSINQPSMFHILQSAACLPTRVHSEKWVSCGRRRPARRLAKRVRWLVLNTRVLPQWFIFLKYEHVFWPWRGRRNKSMMDRWGVSKREKKKRKKYNHSASPSFHKFHTMQKKDINYLPRQSRAVTDRGGQRDRERKELWFYKESICIAVRKHSLREWRKAAA